MEPGKLNHLATDYEQTLGYFHSLHEVRFKLLGFLPLVTGVAVAVAPDHSTPPQQVALACLGLVVTLGIASYDQRNTQIYDRLVQRARFLEKTFAFPPLPGGDVHGGPFHCRPTLQKMLGVRLVWHIQGLMFVYSASIAGWVFLGVHAISNIAWLNASLTFSAFLGSYFALRWVSHEHHKETERIKELVEQRERGNGKPKQLQMDRASNGIIRLDIPGFGAREITRVVSDYTGTHAFAGTLREEVRTRLMQLAAIVEVHILTSDTFGTAKRELEELPLTLHILDGEKHDEQKRDYVLTREPQHVAAFGNGNNDRLLLKTVRDAGGLAVAVDNGEGCALDTILAADLVVQGSENALDLLLDGNRCKATLRF